MYRHFGVFNKNNLVGKNMIINPSEAGEKLKVSFLLLSRINCIICWASYL